MQYLLGALLGAVVGIVALFFAQGGMRHYKLFLRLSRRKGGWIRQRWILLAVGVVIGIYGVWLYKGLNRDLVGFLLLICYLLAMSVTDLRKREIPDDATLFFAGMFFLFQCWPPSLAQLIFAAVGGISGGILLGVPHLVRPKAVGLGDVKLLAVCGIAAGFPGILYILIRGMVVMAAVSLIELLLKRKSFSSEVPLAPFLLLGALI